MNSCRTPADSGGIIRSDSSDELVAQRNRTLDRELAKVKQTRPARDDSRNNSTEKSELPVEKRHWYSFLWPFGTQSSSEPVAATNNKAKDVPITIASETTKQAPLKQGSTAVTNEPPSGKTKWWWPWGARTVSDEVVKKPESTKKTAYVEKRDKATLTTSDSNDSFEKIKVSHMFDRDARGSFFRRKESVPGKTWRWFGWFRKSESSSPDTSAKVTSKSEKRTDEPVINNGSLNKPVKKTVVRKAPEVSVEPDQVQLEVTGQTNIIDDIRSGEIAKEPLLKAGFMLKIVVLASGKKEVDESEKRVAPSGTITLPLVGTVPVDGLTIRQLSDKLKELYSVYLLDPMVDVDFVLKTDTAGSVSPWGYVSVMGRVKKPGRINIPPTRDLTLSMAIQLAEGLDSSAKLTGIKITREIAGKAEQFEVNLQSVGDKGELGSDIKLRPGDVVYVPERVF